MLAGLFRAHSSNKINDGLETVIVSVIVRHKNGSCATGLLKNPVARTTRKPQGEKHKFSFRFCFRGVFRCAGAVPASACRATSPGRLRRTPPSACIIFFFTALVTGIQLHWTKEELPRNLLSSSAHARILAPIVEATAGPGHQEPRAGAGPPPRLVHTAPSRRRLVDWQLKSSMCC